MSLRVTSGGLGAGRPRPLYPQSRPSRCGQQTLLRATTGLTHCNMSSNNSERKSRLAAPLRLDQAAVIAAPLRFLRQPNKPNAPRPVAKSGRAAGSGVEESGLGVRSVVRVRLTVPSPKVITSSWTNSKSGPPKDATNRLAVSLKLPLDVIFGFCCSVSPAIEQGARLWPGSKQVVTLSRLPLLASLTEPEMVVSNKRLLPVGAVKIPPVRGIENVWSVVVPFPTVSMVCIVAKLAVPGTFVVVEADAATTEPQARARTSNVSLQKGTRFPKAIVCPSSRHVALSHIEAHHFYVGNSSDDRYLHVFMGHSKNLGCLATPKPWKGLARSQCRSSKRPLRRRSAYTAYEAAKRSAAPGA